MSDFRSADDLRRDLWTEFEGQHPNNFRRKYAEEMSKRWFKIAVNFSTLKMKINPSKVSFGISAESRLFWPLGRLVLQRTRKEKFRIVSKLSSDIFFDESKLYNHLKIFLFETEISRFLLAWGIKIEGNPVWKSPKWVTDHLEETDDDGVQRKMFVPLGKCVGEWLKIRVEDFPENDFYALTLVVATDISRHSLGTCLNNYPELMGFDDEEPFDIENPDGFPPEANDLAWLEFITDLAHTALKLTFWPPASIDLEFPLEM